MSPASTLSRRLAEHALGVCQYYLSAGRQHGQYWQVGDVLNNPGRSMYVRLTGPASGRGAAGKWTDAATGDHGDLLDVIRLSRGLSALRDVLEEARIFLSESTHRVSSPQVPVPRNSAAAARRLFAASTSINGTLAETYLRSRGIVLTYPLPALRFHPSCFYRAGPQSQQWPALIAAATDLSGTITGLQRTWLSRNGTGKAPLGDPRRALGDILGAAVRFGTASDVLAVGEGVETMLALRSVLPALPMAAALSASHLGLFAFPAGLKRLYIAADRDRAGLGAAERLIFRAFAEGIEAHLLTPRCKDWNADLIAHGVLSVRAVVLAQLTAEDRARFAMGAPPAAEPSGLVGAR